jgi:branched-subunit amino acid ABC-type transport system permease component
VKQQLIFLALGLASGGAYAALGMSVVVFYRSSRVLNFATGGIALYASYTYVLLRDQGKYLIPIPGLPLGIKLAPTVSAPPAFVLAVATSGVLGLVIYALIFRRLRNGLFLSKVVASVGLLTVIEALVGIRLGTNVVVVSPIFPSGTWSVGGLRVPQDDIYFAAAVIVVALVVAGFYRYTSFGLRTRAAAETEKGVTLIGVSPDSTAAINWLIGGVVAGLAGVLIVPFTPLTPGTYSLFIVPAMACALVGRFSSIMPTVIAGLLIGAVQSDLDNLRGVYTWFPQTSLDQAVPFVIIIVMLIFGGKTVIDRGFIIRQELPVARLPRMPLRAATFWVPVAAVVLVVLHGQFRAGFITGLSLSLVALSVVLLTGYVGQISLAQLTFAGIAGFLVSRLTESWGVPFPAAPLLAALAAAAAGVLIGLPALRIRGVNLAVVTIGMAVAVDQIYFSNPSLDGGLAGAPVADPRLFGLDLGVGAGRAFPRLAFGLTVLVAVVLCTVIVARVRMSRLGQQMIAVRANERAAASLGISVARTKLIAFAMSAFLAGLGGALVAYQQGSVSEASYAVLSSLTILVITYLAGVGCISGAMFAGVIVSGGLLYTYLASKFSLGSYFDLVTGIFLVQGAIVNPSGAMNPIMERTERFVAHFQAKRSGPRGEAHWAVATDTGAGVADSVSGALRIEGEL